MDNKKKILLVATGGTIASVENGSGLVPCLSGEQLAAAVPEIEELCDLDIIQLMNIDSTNMSPSEWMKISACIMEHYDEYDGFVVSHGTDTMSYTAAALSYLIQGSPKPIVLTGSQKPMESPFTDAKLNLYQSLKYATDDLSQDVSIVFAGSVIAGTRARKQRTMSHNAFISVNFPEMAMIRNDKILRPANPAKPENRKPKVYTHLSDRVCALKLTPGIKPSIFKLLESQYDALILETFGVGGIPAYGDDEESFCKAIYEWCDKGKTIVLTTQVPEEGLDMGIYEVGRAYTDYPGILMGDDMTTEALIAKSMWVLGNAEGRDHMRELFYRPINFDRVS